MKFNPFCEKPNQCETCENRCIQNLAFLSGMPEEKQVELMKKSADKLMKKGEIVFSEGDKVDSITIIKKGQIKLNTYDNDGRERIIGIFSDNDTIWEGIFLENSRYPYSAVCLTDVHICRIFRKDIEEAVSNPSVALSVINMLSNKLHNANERNMILSTSDPMARIAGFLLYRDKRSKESIIKLRLDDIAGSVGLRPETVSRYLQRLVKEGYIKKVGQSGIEIVNYEALNEMIKISWGISKAYIFLSTLPIPI